eukprot:c17362_g1_i2.p1 GENE.c17362_g1_i2~~c17362_g1_i2.p1  ORF type:complete len:730 (+),score=158.40 c17362_g1_i2:29-2191(+)
MSYAQQLEDLEIMFNEGVLTLNEFERAKSRIKPKDTVSSGRSVTTAKSSQIDTATRLAQLRARQVSMSSKTPVPIRAAGNEDLHQAIQATRAEKNVAFYLFTHVSSLEEAVKLTSEHLEGLTNLLTGQEAKGILVVYVAPGNVWREMVQFVSHAHAGVYSGAWQKLRDKADRMRDQVTRLTELQSRCVQAMRELEAVCPSLQKFHRVRFVSPFDFCDVLDRIKSRQRDSFIYWFEQTTYDAPKLVDAILRLRSIACNVPVLRFDVDVLFCNATKQDKMAEVIATTQRSVCLYEFHHTDPEAQTWWFSGQYNHYPLAYAANRQGWSSWAEGFSTRANPALVATDTMCDPRQFEAKEGFTPTLAQCDEATSEELMLKFYGLEAGEEGEILRPPAPTLDRDTDILNAGNVYIGANPMTACVSGSGFCVSTGLTLDLPPFSNFKLNVMWIDDQLLVTFAREVKNPPARSVPEGFNWYSGNPVKARTLPENPAFYTLEIYLPTLLYGCIFNSWLLTEGKNRKVQTHHYLLKYDPAELEGKPAHVAELLRAHPNRKVVQGEFIHAVHEIITRGRPMEKNKVVELRGVLEAEALERIKDIYYQWREMPDTFAGLWATGQVLNHPTLRHHCVDSPHFQPETIRKLGLGQGLVRPEWHAKAEGITSRDELPMLQMGDVNNHIARRVQLDLIEDAVNYLEWVLVWPTVVQAVRAIGDGDLVSDVSFHLDP